MSIEHSNLQTNYTLRVTLKSSLYERLTKCQNVKLSDMINLKSIDMQTSNWNTYLSAKIKFKYLFIYTSNLK